METKSKDKILIKFSNGVEIRSDSMNWILYSKSPRSYFYFATLEDLVEQLLDMKIKELASEDSKKTLQSLLSSVNSARQEITTTFKELIGSQDTTFEPFEAVRKGVK